jgi:orotate phosphoribosyltransferase
MSPEGMACIGPLCLEMIRAHDWRLDAVGGLTLAADPVAYAIAYASNLYPPRVRAFTVRKEAKQHGTLQHVEGPLTAGDHVVIVEDVMTSGASALRAAEHVQRAGGQISGMLALVDREEGARETIQAMGYDLFCITTVSELLG